MNQEHVERIAILEAEIRRLEQRAAELLRTWMITDMSLKLNPAALAPLYGALKEALEYENDDTECLVSGSALHEPLCPDKRCYDHGCMVARVNRWRAVLALAIEPPAVTEPRGWDARDSASMRACMLDEDDDKGNPHDR